MEKQISTHVFSANVSLMDPEFNTPHGLDYFEDRVTPSSHAVHNFEVSGFHNYIADGVRVHNKSILSHLLPHELAHITEIKDTDGHDGADFAVSVYRDANGVVGVTNHKMVLVNGVTKIEGHRTYTGDDGRLYQIQYTRDANGTVAEAPVVLTGAEFGESVGSLITPFLTAAIIGEDASAFSHIATKTIIGTFVENIFEFAGGDLHSHIINAGEGDGHSTGDTASIANHTFKDLGLDLAENLADNASSYLTQWIMAEVFGNLASGGYGGEVASALLSRGVDYFVHSGIQSLATQIGIQDSELLSRLGPNESLENIFSVPSVAGTALSIGLSRILPDVETVEGQIAQGLTSLAIAHFMEGLHTLGSFGLAGFHPVTAIIATLVGKIFDSLFKKHPEAYTNVIFDEETGHFEVGDSWSDDGGNVEIGKNLANHYVEFMNKFIDQLQSNSNNLSEVAQDLRLVFGHYEESIKNGSGRNFGSLSDAMNSRVLDTIKKIDANDGDLKVVDLLNKFKIEAVLLGEIKPEGGATSEEIVGIFDQSLIVKADHFAVKSFKLSDGEKVASAMMTLFKRANHGIIQFSTDSNLSVDQIVDAADNLSSIVSNNFANSPWLPPNLISVGDTTFDYVVDFLPHIRSLKRIGSIYNSLKLNGYEFTTLSEMRAALVESKLSLYSTGEIVSDIQYKMKVAAEYQEYLEHQSAYDAAILAAGPESAYARAWALTFMEAKRLGITKNYSADGDQVDNRFIGSSGNDSISGATGNDTIKTYSGDDTLHGGSGDDYLLGGSGDDQLFGEGGNDTLNGGSGDDTLNGGAGNDNIYTQGGNDKIWGGDGRDTIFVTNVSGNVIVHGDKGIDTLMLQGAVHANSLLGASETPDHTTLKLREGTVTYDGVEYVYIVEGGLTSRVRILSDKNQSSTFTVVNPEGAFTNNDFYFISDRTLTYYIKETNDARRDHGGERHPGGIDTVHFGAGIFETDLAISSVKGRVKISWNGGGLEFMSDISHIERFSFAESGNIYGSITVQSGGQIVLGGTGSDDVLRIMRHSSNIYRGFNGNDSFVGSSGSDEILGDNGNDTLSGGEGNDRLFGGADNDLIHGNAGGDTLNGDAGNDTLYGGHGSDRINGGTGDDQIHGGAHNDVIDAGAGNDTVWGDNGPDVVNLGAGNDVFNDNDQNDQYGRDSVYGGLGDDTLNGGGGDDLLHGNEGNDFIRGGTGNDLMNGHTGNDTFYGGDGRDSAWMGDGDDIFHDNSQTGVAGSDIVSGDAGNDRLHFGGGNDTGYGGAGADTFLFFGDHIDTNLVGDFERNVDKLRLDDALWGGASLTAAQVVSQFGSVQSGSVVLDFGEGHGSVRLAGLTSLTGLEDDILIF